MEITNQRSVVITGVSSGIGWGTTKVLIENKFSVFGTVRSSADASRLQREFGSSFVPLLADITVQESIHRAADDVRNNLGSSKLSGLVNNAGVAVPGPLLHLPLEEFRRQLEVNLVAQLSVIQAFAPLLGTDRKRLGQAGRIINIGSTAGKIGVPFLGAYVASKHALEGISEALRRELILYGVDVINIIPGAVATAIWDKGESEDLSIYKDTEYASSVERFRTYFVQEGRKGLKPERIGEVVHHALTVDKPKTSYEAIPQRFKNWTLPLRFPKRLVDKLMAKQFGITPA